MTIEEIKTMALVIDHLIVNDWKVHSELTPEGYILAEKGSRKWCIKVLPYQFVETTIIRGGEKHNGKRSKRRSENKNLDRKH